MEVTEEEKDMIVVNSSTISIITNTMQWQEKANTYLRMCNWRARGS